MDEPILTIEEREALNTGRWFSSLSPSLRHDILRCAYVKRYRDGELIAARGDPPEQWIACARGAVRVSSTSISGKQITLTYVEPGIWFGDVAIFDGDRRTPTTPMPMATRRSYASVRVYLTHFHPDHVLGNQAFRADALAAPRGVIDGLQSLGDAFASAIPAPKN